MSESKHSAEGVIGGIIIPSKAPAGIVQALKNFVEIVEAYDETGVWPDNGTIRKLADEGRDALNCGYSSTN